MTKSHHSMISFYMSHPSESGLRFYFIFCTFLHKYDLEKVVYDLLNFWWTLNFLFTCMSNIGICHVLFHVAYGLYLLYFVICHIFFESKGMGVQPALYMSVAFYQCSKLERVYLYLSLFFLGKNACYISLIDKVVVHLTILYYWVTEESREFSSQYWWEGPTCLLWLPLW